MKTKLLIVRHAEAVGNVIRRFHGWTDESITEKGHIQAGLVAKRVKDHPIDVLYSSSMKRTLETAGYIAKEKKLVVIPRDDLKEINGGLWENMSWEDLTSQFPEEYDTWENRPHIHQMPGGESMVGFQERLIREISSILEKEKGKNVCIVTHGTAIRTLLCYFKGFPLDKMVEVAWCDNTAVTMVTKEQDSFYIELEGDASHLDKETSTFQNQEWFLEFKEKMKQMKINREADNDE